MAMLWLLPLRLLLLLSLLLQLLFVLALLLPTAGARSL